jgi:putative peptidoglycan lipid II flippase
MQPLAHVGLALATSLAAFFNVALLIFHVRKQQGAIMDSSTVQRMLRALLACLPMLAFLVGVSELWTFPAADKWMQILWLGITIPVAAIIFFGAAFLFGEKRLLRGNGRGKKNAA